MSFHPPLHHTLHAQSEGEYEAIEAAVMETARGRWFLAEHARRNRHAETAMLLGAIEALGRIIEQEKEVGRPAEAPAVAGRASARFIPSFSYRLSGPLTTRPRETAREPGHAAAQASSPDERVSATSGTAACASLADPTRVSPSRVEDARRRAHGSPGLPTAAET